jgi:hypothetical protein
VTLPTSDVISVFNELDPAMAPAIATVFDSDNRLNTAALRKLAQRQPTGLRQFEKKVEKSTRAHRRVARAKGIAVSLAVGAALTLLWPITFSVLPVVIGAALVGDFATHLWQQPTPEQKNNKAFIDLYRRLAQ